MPQQFIYLPTEFSGFPSIEIGTYAKNISQLLQLGVNVPKSAVIPLNTLKIIAQANNLQVIAYKLLKETDYSSEVSKNKTCERLKHLIKRQQIPRELASKLLDLYHNYFKNSFIKVQNSEQLQFSDVQASNIYSDTNFIDTILDVWAEMTIKKLKKLQLGTESIHLFLFPSPILVQEQIESKISGIAYSFDLSDLEKNKITIYSTWGVFHPEQEDFDTYITDVRTNNIISKQIKTKKHQFRRVLDKLRTDEVLVKNQSRETLSETQLKEITQLVSTLKKQHLAQIEIAWAIYKDKLFVENVTPTNLDIQTNIIKSKKSIFKVFTTVTPNSPLQKREEVDGLVVYDGGQLISASGTHPSEVAKTKQKKYLIEAISRILIKYCNKSNKPLIYRANNFTSTQFNKLKFASVYETQENNPYLGFRGGLRFLSQPEAFKIELESLSKVLISTKQQVTLLLPFIRSPEELSMLKQLIKKLGLTQHSHFSLWLELSTPENVFNLTEYPLQDISGFVFNTVSINSLMTGVDPSNLDISNHYTLNKALITFLVQKTIDSLKKINKSAFLIDLTHYDHQLLEQLCDLNISGFIFNEQITEQAKKCIIERQRSTIF